MLFKVPFHISNAEEMRLKQAHESFTLKIKRKCGKTEIVQHRNYCYALIAGVKLQIPVLEKI